jgi:aspartyl-tRNA(Asn)/glutamyl-tRNA(Gln) amidotransferase subunit C
MNINKELIEHVAEIARLKLNNKESDKFLPQLQDILKTFSEIEKVDTKNIKPSIQPVELRNMMREDKEEISLTQEEALFNTSHKKDGYFKGPKVV